MPALQVKDCPADVYERLRICAAENNRSISQQTLTIIQMFLDNRDAMSEAGRRPQTASRPSYAKAYDDTDYIAKRKKTFERIEALGLLPISPSAPSAVEILAQIREEEAR